MKQLNWVNLLFFTVTPLAAVIVTPIYHYYYGWEWQIFFLTVVLASIGSVSITAGYHRLFSHRAYESSAWLRVLYLLFGASNFEGSALYWCTDHRRHHRYIDTENDPYNIKKGFFHAHMGWFMKKSDLDYESLFPADLLKDPWVRLQHQYYLPIALVMTFGLPTLIGWSLGSAVGGLVYGGLIRVILNQHSTFLINSFCHMFGRQPYGKENTAKDSFLMSLFTFGEGYHNFHHHFQNDYRNGVRWYDWDPTKWFIRGMAAVGVCYRLKKVPQSNIAKARMAIELEALASKGVPPDRLHDLRQRVEQAHRLVRSLYEDYQSSKAKRACLSTKAELRLAQIELRALNKQWSAYTRIMGRVSVAS